MAPGEQPPTVGQLDSQLKASGRSNRKARLVVISVVAGLLVAAVAVLAVFVGSQQGEIKSGCGFNRQLALLQPAATAPAKQPSQLLVALIVNARVSYVGEGCGTPLPPPSPELRHWASFYHLGIPG
jgi:hypothetical protein